MSFVHLFSGLRREEDLEWWLVRLGGSRGLKISVENFDLAYGQCFDLANEETIRDLPERIRKGFAQGARDGSPCSTWSRARFAPGGSPPLRDRERPHTVTPFSLMYSTDGSYMPCCLAPQQSPCCSAPEQSPCCSTPQQSPWCSAQ